MLPERTPWRRLYGVAAAIGAVFGLLFAIGLLPSAPEWPVPSVRAKGPLATVLLPVLAGVLVGVVLAGVAHVGVRWQLRRRARPD